MPKSHHSVDVWVVEGLFQHLIYSPKGGIEGLLIATNEIPTQFVVDPQNIELSTLLADLRPGQSLHVEGTEAGPSPKGEGEHFVYIFERLVSIDGLELGPLHQPVKTWGKVIRFNYAKHGERNGVVLDNGDFIHTKPEGLTALGLEVGDAVRAEGPARPLADGTGRVVEAHQVNGESVRRA